MRLELLEQDVFHTQYQRNNKAKAKKTLRCFPACRHAGHVEAGFCGRPVLVRVHYTVEDLASIGATGMWPRMRWKAWCVRTQVRLCGPPRPRSPAAPRP